VSRAAPPSRDPSYLPSSAFHSAPFLSRQAPAWEFPSVLLRNCPPPPSALVFIEPIYLLFFSREAPSVQYHPLFRRLSPLFFRGFFFRTRRKVFHRANHLVSSLFFLSFLFLSDELLHTITFFIAGKRRDAGGAFFSFPTLHTPLVFIGLVLLCFTLPLSPLFQLLPTLQGVKFFFCTGAPRRGLPFPIHADAHS